MSDINDHSLDDVWEFAEFCAREAMLLRSFLEYVASWPDPSEKKLERLKNWRAEVGLQLGNPSTADFAKRLFENVRAAPPLQRKQIVQFALNQAHAAYFGNSSDS